ncbi:type II secretion system protein J [Neotabrizicola sp. sgz301269]|uniref:type II secretion system protein J n=1 Tax=Neotabrizicola sp. sgz301269 TaxID=3276282 RepID=UPI0037702D9A
MIRRSTKAGITLFETLIALAIMSMLAILLTSGLGFGIRYLDRSTSLSAAVDQALARRALRDWLEHALLAPVPLDNRPLFIGSATELRFLAEATDLRFWPGAAVDVRLGQDSARLYTNGISADQSTEIEVMVDLAAPDARLSFEYWGQRRSDQDARWGKDWPEGAGLPQLVRITFGSASGDLPPMVVRPGKAFFQIEMSLSSLVPPALPSRP